MDHPVNWESSVGRRVRLRELHILSAVVHCGSMAKAAGSLGMSQPAVSEAIAILEDALRVRLLDRSRRGVVPTIYAEALLKRSRVAFDELRQGVKEIAFLADSSSGEVRIGSSESISAAILPKVVEEFRSRYPDVVLQVDNWVAPGLDLPGLRERRLDLVLARVTTPPVRRDAEQDMDVEILFNDPMVLVVGNQHPLARRRRVDLADLVDEPWILPPAGSLNHTTVAEAFRARGLEMPKVSLVTYSVQVRYDLLASGRYVTVFASSNLRLGRDSHLLRPLPLELPARPWFVAIVTLKNRTLNPAAQRFIEHVRGFAKSMTSQAGRRDEPVSRRR
jgi:DNA-binding transcriptional LysR family regulator